MTLWVVRAGAHGEQEQVALDNNIVTIGWNDLPDLSNIRSKEELKELYRKAYPDTSKHSVSNQVGQIWSFVKEIQKGDLVALPFKSESVVLIGTIEGDYECNKLQVE